MKISGRVARQILLLSLLSMIVPAVLFPERLGSGLGGLSLLYVIYEVVFYSAMIFLHDRKVSLAAMMKSVAVCLVFRALLSISFGLMISGMYAMQLRIALMLGMFGYLPGVLLHIVITPFVIRPFITQIYVISPVRRVVAPLSGEVSGTSISFSRERGFSSNQPVTAVQVHPEEVIATPKAVPSSSIRSSENGFDEACRYISLETTVKLVSVVDSEGLLLACHEGTGMDAEEWSPFAVTMFENMANTLDKLNMPSPEVIDMTFREHKLILAKHESICLMVVADRQVNDLLNVRAIKGAEMIKKYLTERHGAQLPHNLEKSHV